MAEALIAGRYQVLKEIGRGGMGRVYRAHDTRLGRTVALKMLPPELTSDPELRRRLTQEARAASALNHPGIATVYDYEEHGDERFIVFEFVEGATLRERLREKRFRTDEILETGSQIAEALTVAHERGIIHRDLKPENIILTPEPEGRLRVKVLDFGLAKVRKPIAPVSKESEAETATLATAPGLVVGTVNYMSPEQVESQPVDPRSDIYALGLVLYELAAGVNPFVGKTHASTIANILKHEAPPVLERNPHVPGELDRIVRKCLRKRPEERYQSAREMRVDLANLRQDSTRSERPVPTARAEAPPQGTGVFPRNVARGLFCAMQTGYLLMYGLLFYHFGRNPELDQVNFLFLSSAHAPYVMGMLLLVAVVGTPVRLYLLSAVSADYPEIGAKYRLLFPLVLLLDLGWSLAPFLIRALGALAVLCLATLLYLPFTQRRLLYDAYSPRGGRTSGIRPAADSG